VSDFRKSKRVTLGQVSALTFMVFAGQAVAGPLVAGASMAAFAISSSEEEVLNRWRKTASTTRLGNELLQILNDCNRSLAINSLNSRASFRRGYLYGVLGCTYSAIADLNLAITIAPYDGKAFAERGLCYMDLKQYDRAMADLNRAVQLQPNSGNALFARARLLLATGRAQQAIEDLQRCQNPITVFATELPGEYGANHYNAVSYYLGVAYEAISRPDKALIAYKESMKVADPSIVGYLHRYADQPADARTRIARLQPANTSPHTANATTNGSANATSNATANSSATSSLPHGPLTAKGF